MKRFLLFLVLICFNVFSTEKMMRTTLISDNFEGPDAGPAFGENSDWEVTGDVDMLVEGAKKSGFYERTPEAFKLVGSNNKSSKSFGFTAKFKAKGYNWLDIKPKVTKKPYKGYVRELALWVWGGKYDYSLEVHLKNHKNQYYRLPMGDIKYYGWKLKKIGVPTSISYQAIDDLIYDEVGLGFVKFRLYSSQNAPRNRFYSFFDYFVVTLDNSRDFYDGVDIERDIESIFGNGDEQAEVNQNQPAAAEQEGQ